MTIRREVAELLYNLLGPVGRAGRGPGQGHLRRFTMPATTSGLPQTADAQATGEVRR
jgi:hypothetical protein